jgi:hypothetical protein
MRCMGRPRKQWNLSLAEVRRRYEAGESAQSLAIACGLVSYAPVLRTLREAGVNIRGVGGPAGPRAGYVSVKETRTCAGDTCENTFAVYPSSIKRFCSPRCRYASSDMAALLAPDAQHRLSEIDENAGTAVCAVCGPVDIKARFEKRRYATKARFRCRGADRARVLLTMYGLTSQDVKALWASQDRRCAICRRPNVKFHVDHCHSTGKIRGLLCSNCNTALGLFGDDSERLRSAAAYLDAS